MAAPSTAGHPHSRRRPLPFAPPAPPPSTAPLPPSSLHQTPAPFSKFEKIEEEREIERSREMKKKMEPPLLAAAASLMCRRPLAKRRGEEEKKRTEMRRFRSASFCVPESVELLRRGAAWLCVRQYREHMKDLLCLSKNLCRTVIVDNKPFSFLLQPLNGIPCVPGQPYDDQLSEVLLPLLKLLSSQKDVRPVLHEKFHMPKTRNTCFLT